VEESIQGPGKIARAAGVHSEQVYGI